MTRWTFAPVMADPNRTRRDRLRLLVAQLLTGAVLLVSLSWLTVPATGAPPAQPVKFVVVVTPHQVRTTHLVVTNVKTYNDGSTVTTVVKH